MAFTAHATTALGIWPRAFGSCARDPCHTSRNVSPSGLQHGWFSGHSLSSRQSRPTTRRLPYHIPPPLSPSGQFRAQASSDGSGPDDQAGTGKEIPEISRVGPTAETSPLVRLAWYGSEAFGKLVALGKGGKEEGGSNAVEEGEEEPAVVSQEVAMDALRKDYERSYFVTGAMTMWLYERDCEFADPFVSFTGRDRFKQNVSNLGSFMEDVSLKLLDWQESEGMVTTKWRFSCVLALPWRPILAASGSTDHYFEPSSGKIYKHVERWDISPVDGVRQLFKPNPKLRRASWWPF